MHNRGKSSNFGWGIFFLWNSELYAKMRRMATTGLISLRFNNFDDIRVTSDFCSVEDVCPDQHPAVLKIISLRLELVR